MTNTPLSAAEFTGIIWERTTPYKEAVKLVKQRDASRERELVDLVRKFTKSATYDLSIKAMRAALELAIKAQEDGDYISVPVKDIKEMAACLMIPDNGVCDTIWMSTEQCTYGLTLFDNLCSYLGDSVELGGSVEEDYKELTGRDYPAAPQPSTTENKQ